MDEMKVDDYKKMVKWVDQDQEQAYISGHYFGFYDAIELMKQAFAEVKGIDSIKNVDVVEKLLGMEMILVADRRMPNEVRPAGSPTTPLEDIVGREVFYLKQRFGLPKIKQPDPDLFDDTPGLMEGK